jgi:hypothetical protein
MSIKKLMSVAFVILFVFSATLAIQAKAPKPTTEDEYPGCYGPELSRRIREVLPRWCGANITTIVDAHNSNGFATFGEVVFITEKQTVDANCVPMSGDATTVNNRQLRPGYYTPGCFGRIDMYGVHYTDLPKDITAQWMRVAPNVLLLSDPDFYVVYRDDVEMAMRNSRFREVLATARFGLVLYHLSNTVHAWTDAATGLKCSQIPDSVLKLSADGKFTLTSATPKTKLKKARQK